MRFAARTSWALAPNRLAVATEARRSAGLSLIDLTESNPTRCALPASSVDILVPFHDLRNLEYEPHPRGLPEAREAICRYYAARGCAVEPENVVVTACTSDAYSYLLYLLLDSEESVAAPSPSYPLLEYLAALHDLTLSPYRLRYDGVWSIDVDSLSSTLRALVVINPNSPTGHSITAQERELLVTSSRARGAALIVDEVFLDYHWGEQPFHSFAAEDRCLTFTLSGLSKVAGLPQMKLSWIVLSGPKEEREEALARLDVIADSFLAVSGCAQRGVAAWLEGAAVYQYELRQRLQSNLAFLRHLERERGGANVAHAEGGWYAVLRTSHGVSDEELALALVEREGIVTNPGYLFDFDEDGVLVISLIQPPRLFQEAAARLFNFLASVQTAPRNSD